MARRQTQKVKAGILNNAFIQSLEWNSVTESLSHDYIAFNESEW